MDADWTTARAGDATLVSVVLRVDRPRRVRVTNELDGPVWPPRRRGAPAAGWDETGFEGRVEKRRALGYATPAAPGEPPVDVEWLGPADDAPERGTDRADVPSVDPTADGVVRALGDPRPPRDAVPSPGSSEGEPGAPGPTGPAADRPDGGGADRAADPAGDASTAGGSDPRFGSESLDAIEERVGRAEALAGADTLPAATAAVEDAGGLAAVRELAARLDDDAAALARIERRARALRERVRSTEVPVETLERLA
ncbi:hypothetical protein BRC94_04960 [Halobacteriales archaeon QS_5_70_17]|nr:MAG: hypothetical protein BRC94_04960 [Halobacteriales archaeon QS_5_70_17]